MKNTGKKYEYLVKEIYKEILKSESIENIKVEHDVKLKGKTTTHQIDVYWEHRIANTKFITIIQAKDWESKVPQKEMLAFTEIIKDLPSGTKGIFISKGGYQKGAIEVAKANGIDIYELRKPNENDFKDKMMYLQLNCNIEMPYYENINIEFNKIKNPNFDPTSLSIDKDLVIYEKSGNKTIGSLILELCHQNGKNKKKCEYLFYDSYVIIDGKKIFIDRLTGIFGISQVAQTICINGYDKIGLILKDIINKENKIFDKQNKFFKDVQE